MGADTGKGLLAGCLVILQLLFVTPLWYYLTYRILQAVGADMPMWVCFWVYVPLGVITAIARAALEIKNG